MKVLIATKTTVDNDKRTLTEAKILSDAGLRVVVVGLLRANQKPLEYRDGFCVKRTRTSLKLVAVFRNPLLRWLSKPSKIVTIYMRLFKAISSEKADYYHAHFPALLMLLTFIAAKLKNSRFIADYNDILVLEQGIKGGSYYEQEAVWGKELNEREQSRINSTLRLVPKGLSSLLDIGCGDGRLTNRLGDFYPRVVGVDISEEALRYVRTEKVKASVEALPFKDGSFDVVLSTELIEHLPDEVYRTAIAEIKRVARKWILVGVPWKEQLSIAQGRCIRCATKFHLNYHYRNFNSSQLQKIFAPEFALVTYQQTGSEKAYYVSPLLWIKRYIGGIWARTPTTICPKCNVYLYPGGFPERNAVNRFCNKLSEKIKCRRVLEKSHVVTLYQKMVR